MARTIQAGLSSPTVHPMEGAICQSLFCRCALVMLLNDDQKSAIRTFLTVNLASQPWLADAE